MASRPQIACLLLTFVVLMEQECDLLCSFSTAGTMLKVSNMCNVKIKMY